MTESVKAMLNQIRSKQHHSYRREMSEKELMEICAAYRDKRLTHSRRAALRLAAFLNCERPVIISGERISGIRTLPDLPGIYQPEEWEQIVGSHFIHEQGRVCNISPDYAETIAIGLLAKKEQAESILAHALASGEVSRTQFLEDAIICIDAVIRFADQYAMEAAESGNMEQAAVLKRVPKYGARTFHEALQSFRIIHFALWCAGNYHNTVGRFDQYLLPYYKADLKAGHLTNDQALDLLEEFFLSFNRDSDLYTGMQQGDNGQSLVLGGLDENGNDCFNELSELCLLASLELGVIDPKINLRVHKGTDLRTYVLGTQLTKRGLGFPQYSNDDVVIPGLLENGYSRRDASNYVTAACWEWIVPGCGMDIPNIGAVSLAKLTRDGVMNHLLECTSFDELMKHIRAELILETAQIADSHRNLYMEPAPYLSVLMNGCIEQARDISRGAKYNNYGLHGTGFSTAVDSLAAVREIVFEKHLVSAERLISAMEHDFNGEETLCNQLRSEAPKFGRDHSATDLARQLIDLFADSVNGLENERGGCYRAGTGSAMYYLWHASSLGATPDGRHAGEALAANFSPSLFVRGGGPVSVIKNFALPNLYRAANGGPLTLELHDTVFRNMESVEKVAALVKAYIDLGGHQLQLNAVNREAMLEAQFRPEDYHNMIVRVWGWSGYFVELDREYQEQIIARIEYMV